MRTALIRNADRVDLETMTIERKDILLRGQMIEKVDDRIAAPPDCLVVEGRGMLCLPAFIDAHTHQVQTFLKGPLDDLRITEWLVGMFSGQDLMTDEEWYYSVFLGCLQSLRFGVTTVNEMVDYNRIDITVQAYRDAGIRVTFGLGSTDIAETQKTKVLDINEALRRSEEIYHKYHGSHGDLLRTSVAPAGMPACSTEFMKAHKAFADERGLLFHTHLAEGKMETEGVCNRTSLRGEGEALYRAGILDEHTVLAHSIWLQDFELDLIRQSGASVLHCPNTNMKIGDGIPKIAAMLEKGINVAIGCDGEGSSSCRDVIQEVRAGSFLQKAVTLDPAVMSTEQCLRMITANGARALHYDYLGAVVPGMKADLVLVDMDDIALTNRDRRVGNLIYAGTGYAVDTVFLEGRMMLRNKQFVHTDIGSIVERCNELLSDFERRFGQAVISAGRSGIKR